MLAPPTLALLLLTQVAPTRNSPCARSDTGNVAQLVASFMAGLPSSQRIPRGAFVLVCGEHIAYAAGFGRTARGAPVDPDRTLFRAASNSKLFAATAAMQLTAASKWKLTDAVNDHLPDGTKLRDGYGRQVTIADLLTHTAGFEDKFEGGLGLATDSISLAAYFARHVPLRVRAAGQELSYSNAGMALAGYAVEVASNESFAGYAERNILAPLGMTHSSFAQPVPAAWEADLATAQPRAARGLVFLPYPAASLVTTPSDMGRFIAAHARMKLAVSCRRTPLPRCTPCTGVRIQTSPAWHTASSRVRSTGGACCFTRAIAATTP